MSSDWPFEGLPRRCARAILADVPWHFKARAPTRDPGSSRAPDRHYATMSLEAIKALPVKELSAREGCHLFFWTTGTFLHQSFEVLPAWGFTYSSLAFVWVKLKKTIDLRQLRLIPFAECDLHVGLGMTIRKNTEICLLGRYGAPQRLSKSVKEAIFAPVRAHSQKPDEQYARIEEYCPGPYVELFARQHRPGWLAWGDQLPETRGGNDG